MGQLLLIFPFVLQAVERDKGKKGKIAKKKKKKGKASKKGKKKKEKDLTPDRTTEVQCPSCKQSKVFTIQICSNINLTNLN